MNEIEQKNNFWESTENDTVFPFFWITILIKVRVQGNYGFINFENYPLIFYIFSEDSSIDVSRIIIFVIGGISFSEMRSVYEVNKSNIMLGQYLF